MYIQNTHYVPLKKKRSIKMKGQNVLWEIISSFHLAPGIRCWIGRINKVIWNFVWKCNHVRLNMESYFPEVCELHNEEDPDKFRPRFIHRANMSLVLPQYPDFPLIHPWWGQKYVYRVPLWESALSLRLWLGLDSRKWMSSDVPEAGVCFSLHDHCLKGVWS